jgi:hypothetical protein
MKTPVSKERAESRVVNKYHKLYKPLIELVDALQDLEPGGTLVDDITVTRNEGEKVRITYVAKPVMLTIADKDRKFILRVIPSELTSQ